MDSIHDIYVSARAYIVQAPWGDLLLVWRPEHWVCEDLDGQHQNATSENKIGRMIIYKICTEAKKKVQINSLDGHILFLGSNQSLCCNAEEYPQLKPDHVYFTDDIDHKVFCTEQNYRLNFGVLDFKSKRVEEIIFPRPWSNCLAPLLIIPNPRKMDLHILVSIYLLGNNYWVTGKAIVFYETSSGRYISGVHPLIQNPSG